MRNLEKPKPKGFLALPEDDREALEAIVARQGLPWILFVLANYAERER